MCLVALALEADDRFPLVIAANRDEAFARATAALSWWSPGPALPDILSGRDLEAGGTWLGLTLEGRLAILTNVRDPMRIDPGAPSRGNIVADWLIGGESVDRFWSRTTQAGYNGFNVLAADFRSGERFWASNHATDPVYLQPGIHGVSNAQLDTPWPKVLTLKERLRESLRNAESAEHLAALLFAALADDSMAADSDLPDTGIALERERVLSSAFIRTPDRAYGTRCSTLVITERSHRGLPGLNTQVLERTYGPRDETPVTRRFAIEDWPPGSS